MFIDWINMASENLARFFYLQCVFSGILFVIIFITTRFLKKTSRFLLFGLWVLLFIRLMLPTDVSHAWSGRALLKYVVNIIQPASVVEYDSAIHVHTTPDLLAGQRGVRTVMGSLVSVRNVLLFIWGLGFVSLSLIYLRQLRKYNILVKRGKTCTHHAVIQMLDQWRQEFNVHRPVTVALGPAHVPPFTVGLFRPVICLPERFYQQKDFTSIESIIAHEMVHIRNLDDVWIKMQNFIQFFYFFNPVVWYAGFQLTQMREQLCDALVISRGRLSHKAYGNGLLNCIQFSGFGPDLLFTMVAFGNRKDRLYDRILNIKRPAVFKKWQLFLSTLLLIILGGTLLPMASATSPLDVVTLLNPLKGGHINLEYGVDWDDSIQEHYLHKGVDIGKYGKSSKIVAAADGVVASALRDEIFHEFEEITLDHANGLRTRYLHLRDVYVKPGQQVKQGQVIGYVPYTLHFEVYKNGLIQDPENHINVAKHVVRSVTKVAEK